MAGMSRLKGAVLTGLDHIRQSVMDILSTPIGTRVGRRDYGSLIPDLIDQPMTAANILRIYAAAAVALSRHEDRIHLRRVAITAGDRPGAAIMTIIGDRTDVAPVNARTRLVLPLSL
ncbi:GPW/gp25 family protein [Sphingobium yanoikuyae]|uniref:Oxidoreductase n=1 Tax=Sphingobium yanoikuyae TaxID=13690 RepID=A0A291N6X4_SPHYA|nr:GPW/gp25 family protein [Sphingobium yanoikuyae]ATI82900.1 oxidoreductase [Sphingobium yanoikuyae]